MEVITLVGRASGICLQLCLSGLCVCIGVILGLCGCAIIWYWVLVSHGSVSVSLYWGGISGRSGWDGVPSRCCGDVPGRPCWDGAPGRCWGGDPAELAEMAFPAMAFGQCSAGDSYPGHCGSLPGMGESR